MSCKLMSYVLELIISDEISKASLVSGSGTERPKKLRKRSRYFVINDNTSDTIESLSDEDVVIQDLTKYIMEQVDIMRELLPGRSVIDILNRIKQMEIARDVEPEISNTLDLDNEF
jgi:hypothetical protein